MKMKRMPMMVPFWNYYHNHIDFVNRIYVRTWIANYDTLRKVVHSQHEGIGHKIRPGQTVKAPPLQVWLSERVPSRLSNIIRLKHCAILVDIFNQHPKLPQPVTIIPSASVAKLTRWTIIIAFRIVFVFFRGEDSPFEIFFHTTCNHPCQCAISTNPYQIQWHGASSSEMKSCFS